MAVKLTWNGPEFERFLVRQVVAGLTAAAIELQRIARKKAGITNAGASGPVARQTQGGNKNTRTAYPNSSKPDESPRRRTGFGQKNIVMGVNASGLVARVGYTRAARYMTFHELGIKYSKVGLQQRPTLVPAARDNAARLNAVFQRAARAKQ